MEDERRINIRVTDAIFQAWDDLRHRQKTSWQDLGMRFFSDWYEE